MVGLFYYFKKGGVLKLIGFCCVRVYELRGSCVPLSQGLFSVAENSKQDICVPQLSEKPQGSALRLSP